jgi:hypothetical protein
MEVILRSYSSDAHLPILLLLNLNCYSLLDSKVDCVTVNDGDAADTKFESKGAEANGGGDDLFAAEDFKGEVGAAFDRVSCIVVCI